MHALKRRDLLINGGGTIASLAFLDSSRLAWAFPTRVDEVVVPWTDQRPENPFPDVVRNQLDWEEFSSWITPNDKFFGIAHFEWPEIDAAGYGLDISGRVRNPMRLTLDDIRSRPRQEVVFTLECSGNHGFPWFTGGVGNARWAGTPLAPVLEEAGVLEDGVEVVFFGRDSGQVEVPVAETSVTENFARSMSLADAMRPVNLLCYEMNGEVLPAQHGHPLRLIAPGWYGIANVKWLDRIEVWPRRYMGQFMAEEYVTLREERRDGETLWTRTSVGPLQIKSVPAKVTTKDDGAYRIIGAAWGAPIARVEVRIDDGEWQPAKLDESERAEHAWVIWSFDWPEPAAGEHRVTSRAVGADGEVQPAPDDPILMGKHTYWESNGQVVRTVRIA
jgi:DMSO/TMAO reductase YedYZ molybdopterin-dependent catalytic subunit